MLAFRNRQINLLVATDVLSRGIDIDGIDLVVNYDVPQDAEDYVHRVGRTARAAREGAALTLIGLADQRRFQRIEELIGSEVEKLPVPESIGKTPEYAPKQHREAPRGRGNAGGRGGKRHSSGGKQGSGHEKSATAGSSEQKPGGNRKKRRRPGKRGGGDQQPAASGQ
ncbi:MAG: DEAD/DEAH box helicase, partial [Saprospiraceae bacterium]|nr:DEAD/DEAH box helicase [Saprospiraceae bacterium]